ncbi:MAG: RNA pyrophosphohydrolase [Gammaproteobacteria bacterium]|nr:RNA pyrophosphohydrolase [Gammaproteobacteria bacterium]MDH5629419.1 RNA pyrophosphohydrolase [Gammaproteobacteria bacterium]
MIDSEGFRANIGIIICNDYGNLLWTRRIGQNSWQFPQGGVDAGETPEQALFRELKEETGLERQDVKILGSTKSWLKYRLPTRYIRQDSYPVCVGQKQKWYLLRLTGKESRIDFNVTKHPEFDHYMWVNYWYPVRQVISFKQTVYRQALAELLPFMTEFQFRQKKKKSRRHFRRNKPG